jgi:hypothetical protein
VAVIGDGAVILALLPIGIAAIVVGFKVIRIQLKSAAVIGDRAVMLALLPIGIAAIVVGFGEYWLQLKGAAEISDGAVILAPIIGRGGRRKNQTTKSEEAKDHESHDAIPRTKAAGRWLNNMAGVRIIQKRACD